MALCVCHCACLISSRNYVFPVVLLSCSFVNVKHGDLFIIYVLEQRKNNSSIIFLVLKFDDWVPWIQLGWHTAPTVCRTTPIRPGCTYTSPLASSFTWHWLYLPLGYHSFRCIAGLSLEMKRPSAAATAVTMMMAMEISARAVGVSNNKSHLILSLTSHEFTGFFVIRSVN